MRAPLLVAGICLVLFFTGLGSVPFYTRGEPREALVAREMVRTGEWLVPSRPEGELTRKPPLFYWVAASALALFPDRPERAARRARPRHHLRMDPGGDRRPGRHGARRRADRRARRLAGDARRRAAGAP